MVKGAKYVLILPIYINDLFPIGDKLLCELEKWIPEYFNIAVSEDVSLFLGTRIHHSWELDPPCLMLNQEDFTKEIARKASSFVTSMDPTPNAPLLSSRTIFRLLFSYVSTSFGLFYL